MAMSGGGSSNFANGREKGDPGDAAKRCATLLALASFAIFPAERVNLSAFISVPDHRVPPYPFIIITFFPYHTIPYLRTIM